MKTIPNATAPVKAPPAKPAAKAEKKVKSGERGPTVFHPALEAKAVDGVLKPTKKLQAWPADYKTTQHKPLSSAHFEDPAVYYNGKADRLQRVVDKLRQDALQAKTLGGVKEKGTAKKMLQLQKRLDDLKTELSGKGVDVEAMLKLLAVKQADAQQPAPAGNVAQLAAAPEVR
jgi:hypothetical protein